MSCAGVANTERTHFLREPVGLAGSGVSFGPRLGVGEEHAAHRAGGDAVVVGHDVDIDAEGGCGVGVAQAAGDDVHGHGVVEHERGR